MITEIPQTQEDYVSDRLILPSEQYHERLSEHLIDNAEQQREVIKSMSLHEKVQLSNSELLKEQIINNIQKTDPDELKEDLLKRLDNDEVKSLNRPFGVRFSYLTVDFAEFDMDDIEEDIYQTGGCDG